MSEVKSKAYIGPAGTVFKRVRDVNDGREWMKVYKPKVNLTMHIPLEDFLAAASVFRGGDA